MRFRAWARFGEARKECGRHDRVDEGVPALTCVHGFVVSDPLVCKGSWVGRAPSTTGNVGVSRTRSRSRLTSRFCAFPLEDAVEPRPRAACRCLVGAQRYALRYDRKSSSGHARWPWTVRFSSGKASSCDQTLANEPAQAVLGRHWKLTGVIADNDAAPEQDGLLDSLPQPKASYHSVKDTNGTRLEKP